jgi:hypothetical protein
VAWHGTASAPRLLFVVPGMPAAVATLAATSAVVLEHVPEKWTRFSDKDMLQVFELARILFDQVIPPDRKAR